MRSWLRISFWLKQFSGFPSHKSKSQKPCSYLPTRPYVDWPSNTTLPSFLAAAHLIPCSGCTLNLLGTLMPQHVCISGSYCLECFPLLLQYLHVFLSSSGLCSNDTFNEAFLDNSLFYFIFCLNITPVNILCFNYWLCICSLSLEDKFHTARNDLFCPCFCST